MNRRVFLLGTTALAGCQSGGTFDSGLAIAIKDVAIIADGLQGILPILGGITGLSTATIADVGQYIANIQAAAAALGNVTNTAAAQPLVQKIGTYLKAVINLLAMLPLPPPISTVLQAASLLMPIIEVAIGLFASPPMMAQAAMTPDQARAVLRSSALRRKR